MSLRPDKSVQGGVSPLLTKPVPSLSGDTKMNMKSLCSTFILTLILATSALAGGMECPTTQPTSDAATTQGSDIAAAAVTGAALSLVGSVVALF